jgi:hypothetical protein
MRAERREMKSRFRVRAHHQIYIYIQNIELATRSEFSHLRVIAFSLERRIDSFSTSSCTHSPIAIIVLDGRFLQRGYSLRALSKVSACSQSENERRRRSIAKSSLSSRAARDDQRQSVKFARFAAPCLIVSPRNL